MKRQKSTPTFKTQTIRGFQRDTQSLGDLYWMGLLDTPEKHSHKRSQPRMGFLQVAGNRSSR